MGISFGQQTGGMICRKGVNSGNNMARYLRRVLVLLLVVPALAGCGETKPGITEIKKGLIELVPAYFTIGNIDIGNQVSTGSSAAPAYKTQFSVEIEAKDPLFEAIAPQNGIALIRMTRNAGDKIKLYGLALSAKHGDAWDTTIQLEGQVPSGKPRGMFDANVFVENSPEAKQAIERASVGAKQIPETGPQVAAAPPQIQPERSLPPTPPPVLPIVGKYSGKNEDNRGTITVERVANDSAHIAFGIAAPGCAGNISGNIVPNKTSPGLGFALDPPDDPTDEVNQCNLNIVVSGKSITVTEESCAYYHGDQCHFDGVYKRK